VNLVECPDRTQQHMILVICALVMGELNVLFIETVILSVPDDQRTLDNIQPLWSALEDYVSQQRIYSLGISDLSQIQLEELYNWASVNRESGDTV